MYIDKSLTLPEVFERVSKKETVQERAYLLLKYETEPMKWYINALYNRDFTHLPIPEYTKSDKPAGVTFMTMKQAIPRLEAALKYNNKPHVVERNLLLVLETVTAEEAELIEKLLKGEKRINGVSKSVFKKAYPQFFRSEQAPE
jgi:hypothetical protein